MTGECVRRRGRIRTKLTALGGIAALSLDALARSHPVKTIGHDLGPIHATEALGIIVLLKAFAAGCSALTGVEAIANGVPQFRTPPSSARSTPRSRWACCIGSMLIGLSVLIRLHHVVPRGNVTVPVAAQPTRADPRRGAPLTHRRRGCDPPVPAELGRPLPGGDERLHTQARQ